MSAAAAFVQAPTVRERPILFSAPMVRAILAGKKTQTRRLLKGNWQIDEHPDTGKRWPLFPSYVNDGDNEGDPADCPYGVPGDRLWVRETFGPSVDWPEALTLPEYEGGHNPERLLYRADEPRNLTQHYGIPWDRVKWRPSIYMPRWASRITLEVTDARVERLQDISEEDAKAEGVDTELPASINGKHGVVHTFGPQAHREAFAILWNGINGKRAPWSSNPFCWVISFRRVPS